MSTESMPIDNLDAFTAARYHPMASDGYSVFPALDRVGQQLQSFRRDARLTQQQVAEILGWSPAKTLRIENGQVKPSAVDARALLGACGINDKQTVDALIQDVLANRKARTTTVYTSILSPHRQRYLGYEAVAVGVGLFAPVAVPDIFQTSHFAATLDTVFHTDRTESEHKLAARLRQKRAEYFIGKYGPPQRVVIDEVAFMRPESGSGMSGGRPKYTELRTIINGLKRLNMAGRQHPADSELNPNISIQIAPLSGGTYFGGSYARSVIRIADRPYAAAYADAFEWYASFDPALEEPTPEERIFDELWADLGGPEHTNDKLDALLESLPA